MLPWLILSVIILTVYIIIGVFWFFFYLSRPGAEYAFHSFLTFVSLAGQGSRVFFTIQCSQLICCVLFFRSGHLHYSGYLLSVLSD